MERPSLGLRDRTGQALFIPGVFGSKLTRQGEDLWVDRRSIRRTLLSCSRDLLEDDVEADGVFSVFKIPRKLVGLGWLNRRFGLNINLNIELELAGKPAPVYRPVLNKIGSTGLTLNAFAYNWAQSVVDSAIQLNAWFRGEFERGRSADGWTIVAHSLGGLVFSTFLALRDRVDISLDRVVLIGTPLLGSIRAFGARCGQDEELARILQPYISYVALDDFAKANLRDVLLNMPSLFDLQPVSPLNPIFDSMKQPRPMGDAAEVVPIGRRGVWEEATRQLSEASRLRQDSIARNLLDEVAQVSPTAEVDFWYSGEHWTPLKAAFNERGEMQYITQEYGDEVVAIENYIPQKAEQNSRHSLRGTHSYLPSEKKFLDWIERGFAFPDA